MRAIAGAMALMACGTDGAAGSVAAAPQAAPVALKTGQDKPPVFVPVPVTRDPRDNLTLTPVDPPPAAEKKPVKIPGRDWRGDEDFYAVLVAHDRAELAWRHFRNRLCAMPQPKRTSLSHVVNDIRERLDAMRGQMAVLWPDAPKDRFRYLAKTDAEPKMLCNDPQAAEEAFQAALAGSDGTGNLIRLVERQRLATMAAGAR